MSERVRSMYYVNGSTVRKYDAMPERRRMPERAPEVQRKKNTRISPKADRALAFNLGYTVFVVSAVFIMIAACVAMLYMESKVTKQQKNINALEAQLETIKDDNSAYRLSLENMYSLDEIYDVATNELGMVYARKGQIVYYDSANEDYVKQYKDVPEAD